ncbi:RidA family protein (plasmid) [Paraburkholderia sp. PREW-6R]|uniref:RidA family protein n=1 Tax=Paraburkholderia sp. PREW-6R TaxID=3141544 RepID=UPI0031F4F5F0
MTVVKLNPDTVPAPTGPYSHGVSTRSTGRTLYIAGQVGVAPDGTLADGFAAQATQCWLNLVAILAADGMTVHDLVKVNTYVTDVSTVAQLGPVREQFLDGARPASTLTVSPALVRADWLIEIEAIAFKAQ